MKNDICTEFARSAVDAAVVEPTVALLQIADRVAGTKSAESFKSFAHEHGATADQNTEFGSVHWHANALGSAIGSLLPFIASRRLVAKLGVPSAEPALTGMVMGAVLTPSHSDQSFFADRMWSGAESAAGLAVLSASPALFRNRLFAGATMALPAALVSTEIEAVRKGQALPTTEDLGKSLYSNALIGAVMAPRPTAKLDSWSPPREVQKAQAFERITPSEYSTMTQLDLRKRFPTLVGERKADVVVIGGGMGGMMVAHDLRYAGADVLMLEAGKIGGATSSKPAAMVTRATDLEAGAVQTAHGDKLFAQVVQDYRAAHKHVMNVARQIDCDLLEHESAKVSYTANAPGIKEEFDLLHKYDPDLEYLSGARAREIFSPVETAYVLKGEGSLNPRKFMLNLAHKAAMPIFEDSHVRSIKIEGRNGNVVLETDHGRIRANKVVFATGGLAAPFEYLYPRLDPVQCFIGTARDVNANVRGNVFDDLSPDFNYYRMLSDGRLLFGGAGRFLGEGDTAQLNEPRLQESLRKLFPSAQFDRTWTGTIFSTKVDGLPFAEQHPRYPQLMVVTGLGGIGLVNSAVTSRAIQSILQTGSPTFYSSERFGHGGGN